MSVSSPSDPTTQFWLLRHSNKWFVGEIVCLQCGENGLGLNGIEHAWFCPLAHEERDDGRQFASV